MSRKRNFAEKATRELTFAVVKLTLAVVLFLIVMSVVPDLLHAALMDALETPQAP